MAVILAGELTSEHIGRPVAWGYSCHPWLCFGVGVIESLRPGIQGMVQVTKSGKSYLVSDDKKVVIFSGTE